MKNLLNRKNIFSANSLALVLLILAIIVVINLISANHFYRLDLTAEKQFSISEATKNTIKNIKDPFYIKVYFSEKLPPDLAAVAQYVKDVLTEYHSYSNNIQIEFIDPTKDPKMESEARALGIPALEMQILDKDAFKIQKGYLGLALTYQDKNETIPVIQDPSNLEYDLTSTIKRLLSEKLKKVTFTTGHGEHGIYELPVSATSDSQVNDYSQIKKALDKTYTISTIDTTDEQEIKDVDTLIIAGPKTEFTEKESYQIDQFIMRGGKVIFLLDEVAVNQNLQAKTQKTGLESLLTNYGVQINSDLVLDNNNENVAFNSGQMQFLLPYPFWPKLVKENFEQSNPIMAKLQSISLAWPSSMTILNKDNLEIKALASSSKNSASMAEPFNLDPQQNFQPEKMQKQAMIVLAKGQFTSLFADKKFSELQGKTEVNTISSQKNTPETLNKALEENKLIAVADSDFISDDYLARFPDNSTFFLNAVDYLTLDSDLISIRAKDIKSRPLKEVSEATKTWIKAINILVIPILVIIIGVVRFYFRKRNK